MRLLEPVWLTVVLIFSSGEIRAQDPDPPEASVSSLGPRAATFAADSEEQVFDLEGGLMVELGEAGSFRLGFDTGQSPPLILSRKVLDRLGLEPFGNLPVGDGSGEGALSMDLVSLPSVRLGAVRFDDVVALVSDVQGGAGSVGFGLLHHCLMTLDQRGQTLTLAQGVLPEPDGQRVFPLNLERTPAVELVIGGRTLWASIDSAWPAWLSLPFPLASELALAEPLDKTAEAQTLFNQLMLQQARLAGRVRLGEFEVWHPVLEFNDLLSDVILGNRFLEEYVVTFDTAGARVRFEPHASAPASKESAPRGVALLPLDEYRDRLAGSIHGQTFGLAWGFARGIEFRYRRRFVPDEDFPAWRTEVDPNVALQPMAGDDLLTETCALRALREHGLGANWSEIAPFYRDTPNPLWHSDHAMRENLRRGLGAPACGHYRALLDEAPWGHADDLDAQMQADFCGALAPCDPNAAITLAWKYGHLMNYGDGAIGACVMAAMNAEAYVAEDLASVVEAGVQAAPIGSRYRELLDDVLRWHGAHPDDWRRTWTELDGKWGADDRCPIGNGYGRMNDAAFNIDAKLHGGFVLMGLLYGEGDFLRSLEITIRCGQDTDTSAQNLGSILGAWLGLKGLPEVAGADGGLDLDRTLPGSDLTLRSMMALQESLALDVLSARGGALRDGVLHIQRAKLSPPIPEQWPRGESVDLKPRTQGLKREGLTIECEAQVEGADGPLVYQWCLGDLSRKSGARVRHTYSTPGTYEVDLYVCDERGDTGHVAFSVVVPPDAEMK